MYELISDHMVIIMTMNKISDGVDKWLMTKVNQ